MSIIERAMKDKKGLRTDNETITLVVGPSMKSQGFDKLMFCCPHGVGSSRIMAGHVLIAALMKLAMTKNPWQLPEIQKLLKTLVNVKALLVVQTVKQRAAAAMRAPTATNNIILII